MNKGWEAADCRGLPLFYLRMGRNGQHRTVYPQMMQEELRQLYALRSDGPQEMLCQYPTDDRRVFKIRLFPDGE